jgi:hypothetical protein
MPNHPPPNINAAQTWVQVLASAYELEPEEVVQDAILAANWPGAPEELCALIRDRHTWDPSIPEYYVPALQAHLRPRRT